ncbi:OCIA domain-containing protein 1 isoform X2 [Sphaerodactylus townsendi]|uniref:OCIA domain-containing protein 1 isoform X2 n=1 Tax=Sphaerodactylus townsendi TaxID=933632 RepID=UPI0020269ED1|nr:OCIA domain-containing protein 1 isoform X2 [Sphaerodactylus townsendi]
MEPHGQVGGESQRPDHGGPGQRSIDVHYIPTEDERRIFKECNEESFWYRSVPLSTISMLVTQMLIKKGTLTAHSRFGSLPKVAFAGLCGYIGGKLSYMKACQEKFRKSENSPLGEALRQRRPISPEYYSQKQEFSNMPSSSPFEMPPATEAPLSSMYSGENRRSEYSNSEYEPVPFSSSMNESTPTGITDSVPQEPVPSLEASSKRKGITYDELRSRNREMYEAGVTQKSELPPKSSHERFSKKEGKVNKYGDAWEE